MCTFELRRMNPWGNLWLQLALCFALLVWMRPPGPQWLAELVKDHQRSGCGTYRFLVSVVYPVLYPSGAPERRLNPAAADSLTCLWIIWVWINTYENTIFSGLFTSILTQLFWCELQGYYWFWPIPIWVFFGFHLTLQRNRNFIGPLVQGIGQLRLVLRTAEVASPWPLWNPSMRPSTQEPTSRKALVSSLLSVAKERASVSFVIIFYQPASPLCFFHTTMVSILLPLMDITTTNDH